MDGMLRIGELASYVGVTTRTVRFYHQRGLLPEPERTSAGYRLYDAQAVLQLSRIVALASAGVPLARIHELAEASDETFAAALAEIDADLRDRIRRLKEDRTRLRHLRSGDALVLPDAVVRLIENLRAAGVDPAEVDHYRDAWILSYALYSDRLDAWLKGFGVGMLDNPGYRDILVRTFHVAELDPDAPEVAELATQSVEWMMTNWETHELAWSMDNNLDDPIANELLESLWDDKPAWHRLSELIMDALKERGVQHPALDAADG